MTEPKEKTRSEEVREAKENIEKAQQEADRIQKLAQEIIEDNKSISLDMEKTKHIFDKNKKIVGEFTQGIVDKIPSDYWLPINETFKQQKDYSEGLGRLRIDIESGRSQTAGYRTVSNTITYSASTSGSSGYGLYQDLYEKYPSIGMTPIKVDFEKTWLEDIEFISQELQKIKPDLLKGFNSVVNDMSGTGDPDLRYKAVLSLRSIIVDQFLDILAPESLYAQTLWYRTSQPGTIQRKKRFCQGKFFILNNRDESSLPLSMLFSINKTAENLQTSFDQMSEIGKKNIPVLVDNCYREALSSFANALKLKSQIQGGTP